MSICITLRGVSYRYPNSENYSLQNIDLSIEEGKFTVIMGPNGSGKTTLCLCLNGLIPQLKEGELTGKINVGDLDTSKYKVQTLARHVGMVLQDPEVQIFGDTVWEDASFGPVNFSYPPSEINERVYKALTQVRLSHYERQKTTELSGGEKQRLALAGVLAQEPKILVLDEPAAELDPVGRKELYSALDELRTQKKLTIIVVEHSPEDILDRADEVIVLNEGQIAWRGNPHALYYDTRLVKRLGLRPYSPAIKVKSGSQIEMELGQIQKEELFPDGSVREDKFKPIIQFNQVSFGYDKSHMILKEINLNIYPGDFMAIIGSNGAGKTTLAKHLNGLTKPVSGTVNVLGMNTTQASVHQLASKVGYLFQNPDHQIFAAEVEEEVAYGLKNLGLQDKEIEDRISAALDFTGLTQVRQVHPLTLSRGDRQKLAVASVIALKPEILVIDEPTAGLDWSGTEKLMTLLKQLNESGTTVIMISHDLELVRQYANRVLIMKNGQICRDGPVEELVSDSQSSLFDEKMINAEKKNVINNQNIVNERDPNFKKPLFHNREVRPKMLAFLVMVITACLFKNLVYNSIIGAGIIALTLMAGVSPKRLLNTLSPLLPVFLLVIIVNSISYSAGNTLNGSNLLLINLPGHFSVTSDGLVRGCNYILRIFMMVFAGAFLTATTPIDEIIQLFHKLRIPSVAAFTITTALRFIPALDRKRIHIIEAQRARGARLNTRGLIAPVRAYIPIMVPLLIHSIVLANSLAMAMLNRGFGFSRSAALVKNTCLDAKDYVMMVVTVIIFCGVIYSRFILHRV